VDGSQPITDGDPQTGSRQRLTDLGGESRLGNGELAWWTLTGGAVDRFAQQVGVTGVAGVLSMVSLMSRRRLIPPSGA